MKISINQPAYIPWLGYFDRIANSDVHIVLDHVQFEKNSMINRNKIATKNGPLMLTIPIETSGKFGDLSINIVQISSNKSWMKKHWNSIFFNYKHAKYFEDYATELEKFYLLENNLLLNDFLKNQLGFLLRCLGINTPILYSSEMNIKEKKSDLILEICKKIKATHYLSGPFGRDYLNIDDFYQSNINVEFQNYIHPQYQQFTEFFISNLSILDLLFHHGNDSLNILRNKTR